MADPASSSSKVESSADSNHLDGKPATLSAGQASPAGASTPGLESRATSHDIFDNSNAGFTSLSRNPSWSGSNPLQDDWDIFPPLDRLTVFDILDNLALPQRLEKLQNTISSQTEKVRRQQQKLKSSSINAKDRVVEEWRRRLPPPDEQLDKYRKRMREGVDRLGRRWKDTKSVTTREKVSFIAGVMNIFISGYLIGAFPQYFYYWFTIQLAYFMPVRFYTYHQKGYHYFLADLCYFVNLLMVLVIWAFPNSKRLFISTYCLAYGNNAVAIAMWRNSLVFHSLDKVTSLFIHIMPPVTLHCIVHLMSAEALKERFPAVYAIKFSPPSSKEHYTLSAMIIWATVPYAVWQLSYHFLITVRRREKIAAGRPTSFTWLRKSYSKTWIGRLVLNLPVSVQESAFMFIQYSYAIMTMVPCPLWFWSRWASATFLLSVFIWSVYNGATYYIDVFGKRFQNELEQLRRDVAKWQNSPDPTSPLMTPRADGGSQLAAALLDQTIPQEADHSRSKSIDKIPPLESEAHSATGIESVTSDSTARARK